ncbi:MAG: M28 family peptidase [Mucilaginibacter polytrichastri]|nr:M28 family peptidase [Mucilaginibacter polytrichastri]
MNFRFLPLLLFSLCFFGCRNSATNTESTDAGTPDADSVVLVSPDFSADSAMAYIKKQVAFGPRIPGTKAHADCAEWLSRKLKSFGANVQIQSAPVKTYDGKSFTLKNIIASYSPEKKNRILITAHWDARPFSDQDPDPAMKNKPFDAANDGGSGVGVILEMARELQKKQPETGIDFILWDIEDYGKENDTQAEEPTWCLGSQYWASHPHVAGYKAVFGVNLDMVGGYNAQFLREGHSSAKAPDVVKKIWETGNEIGYSGYFINANCGDIVDDHYWMNKAGVPSVDIIHYNNAAGFYSNWHTQKDDLDGLDPNVLKAVGQTVLEVIYREKPVA